MVTNRFSKCFLVTLAVCFGIFWEFNIGISFESVSTTNDRTTTISNNFHDDNDWWKPLVDQLAKPFPIISNQTWCIPREANVDSGSLLDKKTSSHSGLYLVKIPKTASSTAAGVTIQIAKNIMTKHSKHNGLSDMECIYHVAHGLAYTNRQQPYFMWTMLREPSSRAISHYFFELVSRRGTMVTSDGMIQELSRYKNYQFDCIAKENFKSDNYDITSSKNGQQIVSTRYNLHFTQTFKKEQIIEMIQKDILEKYHFMGITERMDESLVALKFILGVDLQDIVVLSSKVNGNLDDGKFDGTCFKIQKAYTLPRVDQYLDEEFPVNNYDFLLYSIANRSLDLTIEVIGRESFLRELELYKRMKQLAYNECTDKAIFPCVQPGKPPLAESRISCFDGDIGCGHACVQETLNDVINGTN